MLRTFPLSEALPAIRSGRKEEKEEKRRRSSSVGDSFGGMDETGFRKSSKKGK